MHPPRGRGAEDVQILRYGATFDVREHVEIGTIFSKADFSALRFLPLSCNARRPILCDNRQPDRRDACRPWVMKVAASEVQGGIMINK